MRLLLALGVRIVIFLNLYAFAVAHTKLHCINIDRVKNSGQSMANGFASAFHSTILTTLQDSSLYNERDYAFGAIDADQTFDKIDVARTSDTIDADHDFDTINADHNLNKVNGVEKDDGMELVLRREHN